MRVLIVESDRNLAGLWAMHLQRQGLETVCAGSGDDAERELGERDFQAVVLSLDLESGSALAIADLCSYRAPNTRVVLVTRSTFFSDGSIFNLVPNTAAFVAAKTPPEDLAAIVQHHALAAF